MNAHQKILENPEEVIAYLKSEIGKRWPDAIGLQIQIEVNTKGKKTYFNGKKYYEEGPFVEIVASVDFNSEELRQHRIDVERLREQSNPMYFLATHFIEPITQHSGVVPFLESSGRDWTSEVLDTVPYKRG